MKSLMIDKNRQRLAQEHGAELTPWNSKPYRIALVYLNGYSQGMANLGFQTVYQIINSHVDCLCERFFMPDKEDFEDAGLLVKGLVSLESERPISDFDLVALSISFENDYLSLPIFFKLTGLSLLANERTAADPLILMGGVCTFINPEPLADIVDIIAVGEAEVLLPDFLEQACLIRFEKEPLIEKARALKGFYLPQFYAPHYDREGTFCGLSHSDAVVERVTRRYVSDLDAAPSRNFIKSPNFEFGRMALTEVSRGCSRGCRFCAAGYVYLPPRERSLDNLCSQIDEGLTEGEQIDRVGLVAAAVADYSEIESLQSRVIERGANISISSLRLDALTAGEVENLKRADHKTVAIAPEAGSQRMRDFINKGITEAQIINAVQLLADGGIANLKLYFIVGLPTEEQYDVEQIVELSARIGEIWREAGKKRGKMGTVTLSINPFVPKPFTPLQWNGMEAEKSLKKKYRLLQSAVSRLPNMRINCESIREARMQAFLSRGDRRVALVLDELAEGKNLKHVCRSHGFSAEIFITEDCEKDSVFPWEIIDQGFDRSYLWSERQRAYRGELTPPCSPGCRRCGVCVE